MNRLKATVLALLAAGLFILPGSAGAAPSNAAGAATAEDAVSALVKPTYIPSSDIGNCNVITGKVEGCPITARLLNRLQHTTPEENGNIVTRSQNPPGSVSLKQTENDGKTAHIDTLWLYGAGTYDITFVVVNQGGAWFVDDTYCAGEPGTSIYNAPAGPCTLIAPGTGQGQTPGMPNTGQESLPLVLGGVAALALVLMGAGLVLARKKA